MPNLKIFILLLAALLIGCEDESARINQRYKDVTGLEPGTSSGYELGITKKREVVTSVELQTVVYDGHWFILYKAHKAGGLEHHPDCPKCQYTQVETDDQG